MSDELVDTALKNFIVHRKPLLAKIDPTDACRVFESRGFNPLEELIDLSDQAKLDNNLDIQLKAITQLLPYSYSKQASRQEVKVEEALPVMNVVGLDEEIIEGEFTES